MIVNRIYEWFKAHKDVSFQFDKFKPTHDDDGAIKAWTFTPSSYSKCGRRLWYKFNEFPPTNLPTEANELKFLMGDMTHLLIQYILKDLGLWRDGEDLKVSGLDRVMWRYRYDGKLEVEGKPWMLEIKSTYGSGWNKVMSDGLKPDDLMQLLKYMQLEGQSNGLLLYVGRDNGYMAEYLVRYEEGKLYTLNPGSDVWIERPEVIAKQGLIQSRNWSLANSDTPDVMPARDYQIQMKNKGDGTVSFDFDKEKVKRKSDWQCSYCPYLDKCWEKELKEIMNNKFYINGEFIS